MRKLKVYEYSNTVSREVQELEERFGVPFEEILATLAFGQMFPDELAEDLDAFTEHANNQSSEQDLCMVEGQ